METTNYQTFQILQKLETIEKKIDENTLEISRLRQTIEKLEKDCARMDGHITFVENTYDTLKFPINVVKRRIEQVFGKSKEICAE